VPPGSASNPYILLPDIRISALAATGRIVGSSVAGNPLLGRVINPDGTTRPFNLGTAIGTTGFQQGGDGYFISPHTNAVIPGKSYQTFARISYDVTPDITAYAQGIFSRSKIHYITQTNSLIPPTEAVQIFKGNPFLTPEMDATLPTANDFITVGQQDAGQPQAVADEKTDFWMVTAGLEGKLGNLNWSTNYTHGDSTHDMANSGLYENKKLYAAVDVVLVNGVPTCRVLTTPFAAEYAGCTPLNVLRGNPAQTSPAGYDYVTGTSRYKARIKQDGVQANLSGTLFDLPAGPIDFAVGAEWRKQTLRLDSNADPALLDTAGERATFFEGLRGVPGSTLFYWLTNVGSGRGSMNVKEAYAELAIPLVKDTTLLRELSINGAARITDYSTSGTVKTWKVGVLWKPVNDLLLRANLSRDIRAPNLFELFAGPQSGIGIINDKQNTAGTYGSGQNVNANSLTAGNPDLKPEIAKTLTIGGVFSPSFLHGFSMSIDYYRIRVNDMIEALTPQQIIDSCLAAGGSGVPACDQIVRATPTSFPSLIRIVPNNIAFLKTAGIDIDASYRTQLGNGTLSARLYANYISKFDVQQFAGAAIAHLDGVNVVISNPAGYPKWRGNLTLDYTNGPFGVTISEQYIHKMRLGIPIPAGTPTTFVDGHVPAVWYTDLAVRVTIPHGKGHVELFGAVNNLFDKDPPLIPGTIPGVNLPTNIAIYDFIGRAFTAGVRFKF
jgi:iron complex outermembrane recepter protein